MLTILLVIAALFIGAAIGMVGMARFCGGAMDDADAERAFRDREAS